MTKAVHNFHIPVMGIGFTIDTPLKVAQYGINSVISLVDDILIEKMRKYHCFKNEMEFIAISEKEEDCRAKRITAYLNLINKLVNKKFEALKKTEFKEGTEITKYFEMLPDSSDLKKEYYEMLAKINFLSRINAIDQLKSKMVVGSIDVNIMTKVDKVNYDKKALPRMQNITMHMLHLEVTQIVI